MFQRNGRAQGITVSVDSHTGSPRVIRGHGMRLRVSTLEAVRDETAAYPGDTGPRTVFVVRAGARRFRLVHLMRDRRWTLEELQGKAPGLVKAA